LLPLIAGSARAAELFVSLNATPQFSNFGTLDTTTGALTLLGDNNITLTGLGTTGGVLYGADAAGTLYSVNTANGALTTVGSSGVAYLDFAVANSGLYAVGTNDSLYSINVSTGAATLIGPTGLTASTMNHNSLASGTTGLFYDLMDNVYSLDPTTGAATFVGCGGNLVSGGCSGPQLDAMAASGGTLFGVDNVVTSLYVLSTSTGAMTLLSAITGTNGVGIDGLSAAPMSAASATPIPGALPLFATGLGALGLLGWRRKRKVAVTA